MAKVFVIDDDPEVVDLLVWILKQEGYDVVGFSEAQDARNAIESDPPALIITDLTMPQIGGLDLCLELKRSPRTKQVKIILLSGSGLLERESRSVGADGYLYKPFDLDEVVRCVAKQLETPSHTEDGTQAQVDTA